MTTVTIEVRKQGILLLKSVVTRENISGVFEDARAAAETAVFDRLFDTKVRETRIARTPRPERD